jgi:hypothetical protein
MGKKKLLKKSKKHLEHSEDDDSWSTEIKHRRRFSFDELQLLESIFFNNPCPTQDNIQNIAHQLKAPRKNITTWFQNRRAKSKRKEKDLLLSQNDVGFTYPWLDPSFFMNTSMQQQLIQPYNGDYSLYRLRNNLLIIYLFSKKYMLVLSIYTCSLC